MSAYMVCRNHISFLLEAAMQRQLRWYRDGQFLGQLLPGDDEKNVNRVGQMLWDENKKSIASRYPDTVQPDGSIEWDEGEDYVYGQHDYPCYDLDPVQVIKACDCYAYQSCEHEGWEGSEAHAFIEALIKHSTSYLPGYDQAEWGAPEPTGAIQLSRMIGRRH